MRIVCFALLAVFFGSSAQNVAAASTPAAPLLLRVQMPDGSMERLQVPPEATNSMSLEEALAGLISDSSADDNTDSPLMDLEKHTIHVGSSTVRDKSQTLDALGLKRGSLIRLVAKNKPKTEQQQSSISSSTSAKPGKDRWDPFPDIAKDYHAAMRNTKTRRSSQRGMSYKDLANLQSSLHIVEAQPEGPVKRVYMCSNSAQRFQANCYQKSKNSFECRVGLLLGTVQRERAEMKQKARTSLSSQTESSKYCQVIKVQALYEPPTQKPTKESYDATALLTNGNSDAGFNSDPELQRVLRVADLLGLRPVGWIFAYNDNRLKKDDDSLPVYGPDAHTGSLLQISNMQTLDRIDGSRFATLSMDATTGATEAFQLSDVCVQMVAENLWDVASSSPTPAGKKEPATPRFVSTKHAVLVDGKETKELDSVLCLVNTAMLSHVGSYSGSTTNSVKKSGGVTNKVKKAMLAALEANDDGKLLEILCDMNLLLTFDKTLPKDDMTKLCGSVQKWARGQKRGTELDSKLKLLLRSILA